MSQYHSCWSLQNSVVSYSIPKKNRFVAIIPGETFNDSIYNIGRNLNTTKSTSFGYGNKWNIDNMVRRNSPSPDTYNVTSYNRLGRTGFSFKGKAPFNVSQVIQYSSCTPGPGRYDVTSKPTSEDKLKIPIILKSRIKYFYEDDIKKQEGIPSSQTYRPDWKLSKNSRYVNIAFGNGVKNFNLDC